MNVLSRLQQVATISTVALCISVATISQATAAERYIVSGVASWDTLNIRSQPSAKSAIIGEIPSNGQNINSNGQERQNGRSTWIRVTHNGVSGWVSKRYLATDYTFNSNTSSSSATSATSYTPLPASVTPTARTGSIYDSGATTATRSVYVGPGNGLPAITPKRQTQFVARQQTFTQNQNTQANTGNTHSHPANRCTKSIAHNHAGPAGHSHRYSCQGQATQRPVQQQQMVTVRETVVDNNSHTHPRNQYSNAITHSHASNNRQHSHNYGGQRQQQNVQVRAPQATGNSHTHPRNQFSNAVTHNHASNNSQHSHNYGGQRQQQTVQVRAPQATGNSHTHPRNQFSNAVTHNHASSNANHKHNHGQNRATTQTRQVTVSAGSQVTHIHPQTQYNARTTHTHPGGTGIHLHDFLLPPAQRAGARQQQVTQSRDVNAHTHPKNQFTNSVTHTHANGVNNHSHSYGAR